MSFENNLSIFTSSDGKKIRLPDNMFNNLNNENISNESYIQAIVDSYAQNNPDKIISNRANSNSNNNNILVEIDYQGTKIFIPQNLDDELDKLSRSGEFHSKKEFDFFKHSMIESYLESKQKKPSRQGSKKKYRTRSSSKSKKKSKFPKPHSVQAQPVQLPQMFTINLMNQYYNCFINSILTILAPYSYAGLFQKFFNEKPNDNLTKQFVYLRKMAFNSNHRGSQQCYFYNIEVVQNIRKIIFDNFTKDRKTLHVSNNNRLANNSSTYGIGDGIHYIIYLLHYVNYFNGIHYTNYLNTLNNLTENENYKVNRIIDGKLNLVFKDFQNLPERLPDGKIDDNYLIDQNIKIIRPFFHNKDYIFFINTSEYRYNLFNYNNLTKQIIFNGIDYTLIGTLLYSKRPAHYMCNVLSPFDLEQYYFYNDMESQRGPIKTTIKDFAKYDRTSLIQAYCYMKTELLPESQLNFFRDLGLL